MADIILELNEQTVDIPNIAKETIISMPICFYFLIQLRTTSQGWDLQQ